MQTPSSSRRNPFKPAPLSRSVPLPLSGSAAISNRASTRPPTRTATRTHTRTATGTRGHTDTTTPRTSTGRTRTGEATDSFVIALIDNAVKDVGFCAYNLHSFDVEMRQFAGSHTFASTLTALCVFSPVEILLSVSSQNGLLDQAIACCPRLVGIKISYISRNFFNETNGALAVEKYATKRCPTLTNLGEAACYLALASCGALLRHVEHINQIVMAPSSLRIQFRANADTMFLDLNTLEGLEILSNLSTPLPSPANPDAKNAALLHAIDHTVTRTGKRFLRRALLEPTSNLGTITARQDAAEELRLSETMYFALLGALKRFPDLESAIVALMTKETARFRAHAQARDSAQSRRTESGTTDSRQTGSVPVDESGEDGGEECEEEFPPPVGEAGTPPSGQGQSAAFRLSQLAMAPSVALIANILFIKASLLVIPSLLHTLETASAQLFKRIAENMRNPVLFKIQESIEEVVDPDAFPSKDAEQLRMNGAYAVKSGRNGRLDLCRQLLKEIQEDMEGMTNSLQKKFTLPNLKLVVRIQRGHHFVLQKKYLDIADFPEDFIQVDETRSLYRFSTAELNRLNFRFKDLMQEIWIQTDLELGSCLNEIMCPESLMALHIHCDSIAVLDCIVSYVSYSSLCPVQTFKPRLTEVGPVALKAAHHPILLYLNAERSVPNDIYLDEACALHLISGRNQSGKSTFIRMVASICILAHTGCQVPAVFASVCILRRIGTRLNNGDAVTQSQSHFSREMTQLAAIFDGIQKLDPKRSSNSSRSRETEGKSPGTFLVVIDELGRATTTLDGFSIAYAVMEELASCRGVLTLFTTHFSGLGGAAFLDPAIQQYQMKTIIETIERNEVSDESSGIPKCRFTYKIGDGLLSETAYGLETARLAGFPEDALAKALELRPKMPVQLLKSAEAFIDTCIKPTPGDLARARNLRATVNVNQRIEGICSMAKAADEATRRLEELHRSVVSSSHSRQNQVSAEPAVQDEREGGAEDTDRKDASGA